MESFDFPFSLSAKWGGIGVLLAWWLAGGILLTFLTLKFLRHDIGRRGTRRTPSDPLESAASAASPKAIALSIPEITAPVSAPHGVESMPPVPRITYTFSDVTYTVRVPRAKGDTSTDGGRLVDKVLLRGVTGYFEPVRPSLSPLSLM